MIFSAGICFAISMAMIPPKDRPTSTGNGDGFAHPTCIVLKLLSGQRLKPVYKFNTGVIKPDLPEQFLVGCKPADDVYGFQNWTDIN
jgi:hypothetical protein